MQKKRYEITKEDYMKNIKKTSGEINTFILNNLPKEIVCGYGYYGGRLLEIDGKFYIEATCGDSC